MTNFTVCKFDGFLRNYGINGPQKKKIMKRDEDSIRDLWDNIRYANTHIIGILGEEKEKWAPNHVMQIFTDIMENLIITQQ